jgi:hypothetical protein
VIFMLIIEGTERDSTKDEAVVIIFILATSGLLTWAVFRPWVQGWIEVSLTGEEGKEGEDSD